MSPLRLAIVSVACLLFVSDARAVEPVQFSGLLQTYRPDGFIRSSGLADMTTTGPIPGTIVPLGTRLSDVAFDPGGSGYYGAFNQVVYHIDPATHGVRQMTVRGSGTIFDDSWPIGLTWDTTRDRLVVATLAGAGYLLTYDPSTELWSTLHQLNHEDLQSIAYRPSTDTLYGLPDELVSGPIDRLYKYNANGQFIGYTNLTESIPRYYTFNTDYQLLLTSDDRFALLTPPLPDPAGRVGALLQPRVYLIDPATGAITYDGIFPGLGATTSRLNAVPESGVSLVLPALGLLIATRTPARSAPRTRA